ncbi:hypothetical protein LXL04_005793 [Taraxacum kok-saghyz]
MADVWLIMVLTVLTQITAIGCGLRVAHNASESAQERRLQLPNTAPDLGVVMLASSRVGIPTGRNVVSCLQTALSSSDFFQRLFLPLPQWLNPLRIRPIKYQSFCLPLIPTPTTATHPTPTDHPNLA